MGSRLLCCVAVCLLGSGPVDSGVSQTPRHLIKAKGQQVTLRCSPISGHNSVFWYQQPLGQGPQFLIQYHNGRENEKGNIPDRFSGQQFGDYSSELNVSLNLTILELTDSALYLCASSLAQRCRVSSQQHKNIPALAQEVIVRVAAASQTGSVPHISDRPSTHTPPGTYMCCVLCSQKSCKINIIFLVYICEGKQLSRVPYFITGRGKTQTEGFSSTPVFPQPLDTSPLLASCF
uniref:Ig-like domain-containing protein n=1 Tax=Equus asinus TaxID=9793 RepID=A0A8C4LKR8_EQUAS